MNATMTETEIEPLEVALAAGRAVDVPTPSGRFGYIDADAVEEAGTGWVASAKDRTHTRFYLQRGKVYLHRLLTHAKPGEQVDHINGNTLDNRKANLRIATPRQNSRNRGGTQTGTTGYKNVSTTQSGKYRAWIHPNGRHAQVHIGTFDTAEAAARARDEWVRVNLDTEFETFNFPLPGERSAL